MLDGIPKNLLRLSRKLKDSLPAALPIPLGLPAAPRALTQALREATARVSASRVPPGQVSAVDSASRAIEIPAFGDNPGRLRMLLHVPATPPSPRPPLVVVLHGCGQHAAQFAADTGWIAMADRLGLVLLLPEQVSENNAGRCFNWFQAGDTVRDQGEARSIREMVAETVRRYGCDQRRIFVVGLSAGGGMAAALLAAYPDVFAAGAVVAGLPIGVARSVGSAMSLMGGRDAQLSAADWAARARALAPSGYDRPWPRLQIWHGTADRTVACSNADALATQWAAVTGVAAAPAQEARVMPEVRRRRWDGSANPALESWTVDGMAHGYPIGGRDVADRFVVRAPIDATAEIARFWGLLPAG